jgi:putative transposase
MGRGAVGGAAGRLPGDPPAAGLVPKLANVLGCLPAVVQAGAPKALAEIRDAPDREHAEQAIEALVRDYGAKWPKAVAKITDDAERCCASSTSRPSIGGT